MADNELAGERDLTRVRKKVEALRAWQLTEVLNLDEETSSRLFPAMRQADQERWKIETRNRELVREMSHSLAGPGESWSGPKRGIWRGSARSSLRRILPAISCSRSGSRGRSSEKPHRPSVIAGRKMTMRVK
jgi:hypothetical protein